MMQTLRKYMKHILWVVAVAFIATIVFSWGMGGFKNRGSQLEKGIVGVINGQEIQFQQFKMLLDQEYDKVKEQYPDGEIPEFRRRALRDQVWQTVIRDVLFQQEINRIGLSAAPQEVVFVLQNNPPEFLRNQEEFQTDGQFDLAKYQQALSDPRNYDAWIPVENYLRSSLPPQKLTQRILTTVRITDSEIRQAYRLENQQVNAEYLFFDPNKASLENIVVSDREIMSYYKTHLDEYRDSEKRKIQYVKLEGKPSSKDSIQVREDILQILDLIKDGQDFETLAKENSEDGSAAQGGDLGFFGKGSMVKPFEDAAFNGAIGEVIGPVQTQFGEHLIKVIARKTENDEVKVRARHILLKYKATPETYDALNDQADYIYEELQRTKGKYFDGLAQDEHLELKETDFFPAGGFIPGLGMASRISHFAFLEDKNWYSRPMGQGDDIILFQITDIQPERTRPLEEVRTSIVRLLERDKKMEAAGESCRRIYDRIGTSGDLTSIAGSDSLDLKVTGPFALQGYVPEVGKDPVFAGTAFRLSANEISEPVKGTRGWYIIKLIEKIDINEESLQAVMAERRQTMQQAKMQQIYMAWFNDLQEKADIEDNRSLFF